MPKKEKCANTPSVLMQSDGWRDCVQARLLRKTDSWEDSKEARSYLHILRRLFGELAIDALLCVEGRPTVCVRDGRRLSSQDIEKLRHSLWNLGATTLLIVEQQNCVNVFSTLVKPERDDTEGRKAQLTSESIFSLTAIELALRLRQFVRRVETGAIYREHSSLFTQTGTVDQLLLSNLRATRDKLCPNKTKAQFRRAHALIGRFLFSCYLFDRGIIDTTYLTKKHLPAANDMLELLREPPAGAHSEILKNLFEVLQRDFNGSLFGEALDTNSITTQEVRLLQRFLAGEDINSGQQSLFKLYDFSFIPVELISSIYEEFLGSEAEIEDEKKSSNKQRKEGAYYTPPRLAELAVDIATQEWNTLLDKRCFDPACGSGIFLVILFIRMAEEWRKRNPNSNTQARYEALLQFLAHNIRGTDINATACLVSCFSLYLAFLDQMEPKAITELREALDKRGNAKMLPRILWNKDNAEPQNGHLATIREADFFDIPTHGQYDLVIGNPPWVSRKRKNIVSQNIESWLLTSSTKSLPKNPYLNTISKSNQKEAIFPSGEFACAFMWKSGLHTKSDGKVCQILPSRVFIASQTNRFQEQWLRYHKLETMWLLADWRFILFPTANCPCFITRYHKRAAGEELGSFEFIAPKVENIDPREALIPISPEDQKILFENDIFKAAQENKVAFEWKKNYWGTPRDLRLLERLMRGPRLHSIAKRPPKEPIADAQRKHYWYKGQGFKPVTESAGQPKPVFWKPTDKFIDAKIKNVDLILLPTDCRDIGDEFQEGLNCSPSQQLFRAPLLLINQGCTKFLYSDFDVLFRHSFQSICAPKSELSELLFLTAYLSSPLAHYLLFHTTVSIGIERDRALLEEVLDLPFPLPPYTKNETRSRKIVSKCAESLLSLRRNLDRKTNFLKRNILVEETQKTINEAIYDYFDINHWEREIIEDTVNIFSPSSTPTSLTNENLITIQPTNISHREKYAQTLVRTFRDWAKHTKREIFAQGIISKKSGLAIVTLIAGNTKTPYSETEAEDKVEYLLKRILNATARESNILFSPLRGFAFYEADRVHILKPLSRRHWTSTAALNDADDILSQMMEECGWQ